MLYEQILCALLQRKMVVFFHNESTVQINEDQPIFWGTKGTHILRPKGRGAGIMVSDFIDKHNGYLTLSQKEYDQAKKSDPTLWMHARVLLECGESKEGYWTADKFSLWRWNKLVEW